MTEPLIDREQVALLIYRAIVTSDEADVDRLHLDAADMVLGYLREVLTPEALWPPERFLPHSLGVVVGIDLHDRIFGEDQ